MFNFPEPKQDELVYSLLARARVKFCEMSPKLLIEKVLGSRLAISSLHFPSNIHPLVSRNFNSKVSVTELIYSHTLFPLYAPFIPERRRIMCIQAMHDKSFGQPYLATGFAASRIPTITGMRYCPNCMADQIAEHGEPYWQRIHQVAGIDSCILHQTKLEVVSYCQLKAHRHEYFPANNFWCKEKARKAQIEYEARLYQPVRDLLDRRESTSPSHKQWTQYYNELLKKNNCNKGKYVDYEAIKERVLASWSLNWLKRYNLHRLDGQSSWLHGITRKHRKSFSYLEHFIILEVMNDDQWTIDDVLKDVLSIETVTLSVPLCKLESIDTKAIREYKRKWLDCVKNLGAKLGRISNGAVYIWLYRHQRKWLLKLNSHYKRPIFHSSNRLDWGMRDIRIVRRLINIRNQSEENLNLPRKSKNWFLNQLKIKGTISKSLLKLPITKKFLNRYEETVADYQIRRLSRTIIAHHPHLPPRWIILRESGLSDERITVLADKFLKFGIGRVFIKGKL